MTKKYKRDADKKIMTGTNVYVFHNIVTDIHLFVNATDADEAMQSFDQCGFEPRSHWKIFLELDQQPFDGPEPQKKKLNKKSKFDNRKEIDEYGMVN